MRRIIITIFATYICSLIATNALCGAKTNYIFRQLNIKEGLSDSRVRDITMTPDGIIAIRTNTMINFYNGATFTYHRFDPKYIMYRESTGVDNVEFDQMGRMWLKNRDQLWCYDINISKSIYDIAQIFAQMGITAPVVNLFTDDEQNYWIVTKDNGLYCFDITSQSLITIADPSAASGQKSRVPRQIVQNGDLYWILYNDWELRRYDMSRRSFTMSKRDFLSAHNTEIERVRMIGTAKGNLWVMYNQGIFYYDTSLNLRRNIEGIELRGSDLLTSMDVDKEGNVWLGSSKSGLRIIDGETFEIEQLPYLQLLDKSQVSHSTDISDVFIDINGVVWLGTHSEGVLYYHKSMNKFPLISNESVASKMFDNNVKCMVEDVDGTILMGTISGLFRYNPTTGSVSLAYKELANELCVGLYRDSKGCIWLGTFQNGAFSISNGVVRHYSYNEPTPVHISYYNKKPHLNSVRTFFEDFSGQMWISVYGGVGRFDKSSGTIALLRDKFPQVKDMMLTRNIISLGDSILLMGSDNGLYSYCPNRDKVSYDEYNQPFIGNITKHNCILKDSRSILWFGTHEGLYIWDPKSKSSTHYGIEQGFPDNIQSIIEDDNGYIWMSSPGSLNRFSPYLEAGRYRFAITGFNSNDGIQEGSFFEHSVAKSSDGTLYFGGTHGMNIVSPHNIVNNTSNSKPIFTDFKLFNNSVPVAEKYNGRVILPQVINRTKEIKLRHNESFITLEFAGKNYMNPAQTYYRYKLEKFDQDWTEIHPLNGLGLATYTFLNPGTYIFKVYTANNDKVWSREYAQVIISVSPPFWNTIFAWILYIVIFFTSIYLVLLNWYRRNENRLARQQEIKMQRQQEELDQLKLRFFTNVSHELRTPLSLIITPLDTMIKRQQDAALKGQLSLIYRNAEQLLALVNQLLDFRKLEMNAQTLTMSKGNIIEFIDIICLSFNQVATTRQINFEVDHNSADVYALFDIAKLRIILNNLLSNAFKFTSTGGLVSLKSSLIMKQEQDCQRQMLLIEIQDSGIGMASSDLPHIFTRFFQATNSAAKDGSAGSGIGLHLVREYVTMHNGEVWADSVEGSGSTFTVMIPILGHGLQAEGSLSELHGKISETVVAESFKSKVQYTIMLVEDNEEFRHYVSGELSEYFNVVQAADGLEALTIAASTKIDLVVSDVMMPNLDGFEMCRRLKTTIETSHIPIILLTAHSSDTYRISGYEAGADEYIPKPFNFDILLVRINRLIEQQRSRIETFSKNVEINPREIVITPLDEKLINKVLECVEKNIGNTEFSVEDLSLYVGMHRMNLYRKLHSIVGQTPSEFIRSMRLKRAAQLLQSSQLQVSEIAFMVGFNSPKYFAKYFKEQFGLTPSQYKEQYK